MLPPFNLKSQCLITMIFFAGFNLHAQNNPNNEEPIFSFKNGLGITSADSSFAINIRFRIQSRFLMNTQSASDFSPRNWEARVRRARLSFAGYVYNPKLSYYLQLSFSRGDLDWNDLDNSVQNTSPNIVRDAMIFYRPNEHFQFGFGQGKLPGNRQRVVSSGSLQFYDRSPVNGTFTPDRDFGFFTTYVNSISNQFIYLLKGSITSGEGRNSVASNTGLAYTGRVELLPFGEFSLNGDYFEGDIAREPTPKLSIAAGGHFNDLAIRTRGQTGQDLYQARSFSTFIADFLFKYNGWALSSEYLKRQAVHSPITINSSGDIRDLTVGDGTNTQLSYCFPSSMEIAARYSIVTPDKKIQERMKQVSEIGIGITKYLMKHKTKAQFNVFYHEDKNVATATKTDFFFFVFQIEAGI
ncbi:MAG: porin [Saprospiraceae bacterium]